MEKYAIYQLKNAMLKVYSSVHRRGTTNQARLFEVFRVKEEDRERFIAEYESLIAELRKRDVDELIPTIKQTIQDHRGQIIIGPDYISAQALHHINQKEDDSLQEMLREQPSTVDFLINKHHYDPTLIHNLVIWLLPTQGIEEHALKNIMDYAEDGELRYYSLGDLVEQFPNPYGRSESPLFQIITILAIHDQVDGMIKRLEAPRPVQKPIGDI
jgi:hypothetical protein